MNEILATLPCNEAETILVNAASIMLPDPGVSVAEPPEQDNFAELRDRVITEIRRHLNIPTEDDSPEARQRIIAVLAQLMNDFILASEDESQVQKRLARKGLLRTEQYEITLEPYFTNGIGGATISPQHVMDAMRRPSVEGHYDPDGLSEMRDSSFSISLRRFGKRSSRKSYTLLVIWSAEDGVKRVICAWRIYDDEVPHSIDWSPLRILRAFLDVFGCEFRLLDREPSRVLLFDTIPVVRAIRQMDDLMRFVTIENKPETEQFVKSQFDETLSVENIRIFFVVDVAHYAVVLRRHGLQVPSRYLAKR